MFEKYAEVGKGYERQLKEGKVPVLRYDDYKDFNFDIETWKEIADNINDKNQKGKN